MQIGIRRIFGALVVTASLALIGAGVSAQAPPPAERVPLTDDVFKTVTLLRGIPVDTFFDAMGMFANAMGNDCTFCHASKAYFDKSLFAEPTPRIQKARQMIVMVNALNKQYFGGQTRVTCFTCHQGSNAPSSDPNLMLQYGTPVEDPNVRDFPTDTRITADAVFDKYVQALGGAQRVKAFQSFTAKGNYSGFDTSFDKVPVEVYGRAPSQQAMVVHFTTGVSTRAFDGTNGWIAGPETPLPLMTLSEGNLDRARLEGLASFPMGLRTAFPQWRGGRTAIDEKEVVVLQGLVNGDPIANLYFDETGLLVRMIRWVRTPVGYVPTKIDYSDYRDVGGLKVPFTRVVTQTYMQMTVELTDVQPNATVAASRFAKPTPFKQPRS
jgi:hypothetical protein